MRRDCPGNSRGFARWRCTKPGQWARDGPDLSDCRPKASPAQENLPVEIAEKFKETDLAGVLRNLEMEIGKQDNEAKIVQLVENVSRKIVNSDVNSLQDQNFQKVNYLMLIPV